MACNSIESSSSTRMMWKYDVFVSFRGEDTRNNFTDHLFGALHRNGIVAFKDDTKLEKGEHISSELLQAIEGSRILIVVLSRNYASSTWCLRELAKIADCIQVPGQQTVLPIFYDVNPSEVRKQSGDYAKAFVGHEEGFKENLEEVQSWRGALAHVANLSGWDVRDKPQYAVIGEIIKKVTCILGHEFSTPPCELVGTDSQVQVLENLLDLESKKDVKVIGICGMGGVGKTTLATVLYDRMSNQFDVSCFIDDVSKIYGDCGPIGIQKQLLCQTLKEENLPMCNLSMASKWIRTRLCQVKALIVLDNVDQVEQIDKLAMKREWLGVGSRIIIISRDEHILREHEVDGVYKVQLLDYRNALKLFCRKAFKCDEIKRGYIHLTKDVLRYANGLPLAIKVLGSFLYCRGVSEWRSALVRLREDPKREIMDVLRISFDRLEDTEKEIFLDIACFFYNYEEPRVKKFLEIRGFHPEIGIKVLIDKSLITIKGRIREILMHDLLRELGKSIVREKSPKEPRKWSRLWDYKDVHNFIPKNMETGNLEAIVLQPPYPKNTEETWEMTTLRTEALAEMRHLKLLILVDLNFSGSLNFLSSELRYLDWDKYPFAYLPSSFEPDKLVELRLSHSNIKQLWEGTKPLPNVTRIDLSHSANLIKLPNFREIPNLVWLHLRGCIKLRQIDPSIGILKRLATLDLENCKNLVSIPNSIFGLSSLSDLNLSGCSKLLNNQLLGKQRQIEHLEMLDNKESTTQRRSTSSIYKVLMPPFRFFCFKKHEDSVGSLLPSLLSPLSCFRSLDLSFCNLRQIPDAIGWLHCLVHLNLGGNNFVTLPCSIKELSKLVYLNLEHCKQLKYLPELPSIKTSSDTCYAGLYIFDCANLSEMECCYRMVFSWMIQLLEVHMQSRHLRARICIVIPQAQIPMWINNQKVGSSIRLDPSPIMHDNNWIGVACCLTFVAHDDPTNLCDGRWHHDDPTDSVERWRGLILLGFRKKPGLGCFTWIPIHFRKDLVTVESDHLSLIFLSREEFIDYYVCDLTEGMHDMNGIEMETTVHQPRGLHLEVKNCGYRWVFKEDLEQLNPKMMYSGNSPVRNKFLTND